MPHTPPTSIGKYQITDLLGQGAMGVVYRALDPLLNRYVAVKVMTQEIATDTDLRDRFMREARAAGSLQHPNIITIYDFGEVDGHLYIAMEYLEGSDLSEIMERKDAVPLTGKIDIMVDVLHALDYAHSRQVVHRDVKPANIRVSVDGRAKLMDFGIARLEKSELTKSGIMIGTPDYMAPEQVTAGKISFATDVFAVGVVMYEFLTGRRTFDGDSLHAVLYQVINQQPPPLRDVVPALPMSLQPVLDRALAKDPAARYASAGAMARDLASLRTSLSGPATVRVEARATPLRTARIRQPAGDLKRRRAAMGIGVGGLALAAAAGVWFAVSSRGGRPAAAERPPAGASAPSAPLTTSPPAPVVARRESLPASPSVAERRLAVPPPAAPAAPAARRAAAQAVEQPAQLTVQPTVQPAAGQAAPQPAPQQAQQASPQAAAPVAQPLTQAPPPSPPAEAADPRPQIEQLVDAYARAIESRSVSEIRRVYPGLTSQQQQGWERFFQSVRSMRVQLEIAQLAVSGGAAELTATGSYDYDTSGGIQHQAVSFHATAALEGGAWRLRTLR